MSLDYGDIISIFERHIDDLAEMKRTDPEFYRYLCGGTEDSEPTKDLIEDFTKGVNKLRQINNLI